MHIITKEMAIKHREELPDGKNCSNARKMILEGGGLSFAGGFRTSVWDVLMCISCIGWILDKISGDPGSPDVLGLKLPEAFTTRTSGSSRSRVSGDPRLGTTKLDVPLCPH